MHVSITVGCEDGEYVTVEAEHETEAFSPDVLDSLLTHCAVRASALYATREVPPT